MMPMLSSREVVLELAARRVFARMLQALDDPARLAYWTRHRERLAVLRGENR